MGRKKRKNPYGVDASGVIHNPTATFTVNDNGVFIGGSRHKPFKPKPVGRKWPPHPTPLDLARLEDAIFNHGGEWRSEFLQYCTLVQKSRETSQLKPYCAESTIKTTALEHFWVQLRWRPSRDGYYVFIRHPADKYNP